MYGIGCEKTCAFPNEIPAEYQSWVANRENANIKESDFPKNIGADEAHTLNLFLYGGIKSKNRKDWNTVIKTGDDEEILCSTQNRDVAIDVLHGLGFLFIAKWLDGGQTEPLGRKRSKIQGEMEGVRP